jgi:outer membrane protein assembly factor BamB
VVHASPALLDGRLYIGSWDANLYALDAESGRELWRFHTLHPDSNHTGIQSSVLAASGKVYFGCRDGFFYALDAKNGELKWKHDHKGTWVNASPALVEGLVVYGSSIPSLLTALDAETGAQRWVTTLKGIAFSSPAATRDGILQGTFAGNLACHDAQTGVVKWEFHSDARQKNERGLLKEDGSLDYAAIFRSPVPRAYYFENAVLDMERMFSVGSIVGSPLVADGVIYVGATDGFVYALK